MAIILRGNQIGKKQRRMEGCLPLHIVTLDIHGTIQINSYSKSQNLEFLQLCPDMKVTCLVSVKRSPTIKSTKYLSISRARGPSKIVTIKQSERGSSNDGNDGRNGVGIGTGGHDDTSNTDSLRDCPG